MATAHSPKPSELNDRLAGIHANVSAQIAIDHAHRDALPVSFFRLVATGINDGTAEFEVTEEEFFQQLNETPYLVTLGTSKYDYDTSQVRLVVLG
jgi:hypothetical protein